jgi:hypothetical protein
MTQHHAAGQRGEIGAPPPAPAAGGVDRQQGDAPPEHGGEQAVGGHPDPDRPGEQHPERQHSARHVLGPRRPQRDGHGRAHRGPGQHHRGAGRATAAEADPVQPDEQQEAARPSVGHRGPPGHHEQGRQDRDRRAGPQVRLPDREQRREPEEDVLAAPDQLAADGGGGQHQRGGRADGGEVAAEAAVGRGRSPHPTHDHSIGAGQPIRLAVVSTGLGEIGSCPGVASAAKTTRPNTRP